jgi:hypothetical protein
MDESSSSTPRQVPPTTQQGPSPSLNGQNPSSTSLVFTGSSRSYPPSLTAANPSLETSASLSTKKPLNVTAIAIGATGAALLLIVCASMIFYLRKKKQKKRVPPSAEFMDVAVTWPPRAYHKMNSPTFSTFTAKGGASFASPVQPLTYNPPVSLYSPPRPPWEK